MTALVLPGNCDRTAAKALFPDVADALGPAALAIDASKVERIGQAMLQLLVSAAHTEGGITLIAPSEPVREALRLTGLEALLEEALPSA